MKFQVYRGKNGKWFWRATAKNGRILADGAQGYASERGAHAALQRFLDESRHIFYFAEKKRGPRQ